MFTNKYIYKLNNLSPQILRCIRFAHDLNKTKIKTRSEKSASHGVSVFG